MYKKINKPLFTIVTPVKDDIRILDLIKSLKKDELFLEVEYLIVFNGSQKLFVGDVMSFLKGYKNVRFIELQYPSIPKALNTAIKEMTTSNLVIIDSDCEVSEKYIENMSLQLNKNKIVCGNVVFEGKNRFSKYTAALRTEVSKQSYKYIYAANLGINKEIFLNFGVFNETLKYGFDSEFSHRINSNKIPTFLAENVTVTHQCHTNIFEEFLVWYHYGRGRCYRYVSGWLGKPGFKNLYKTIFTPKVTNLNNGFVYNIFAASYLFIRNIGFFSSLISKKYD